MSRFNVSGTALSGLKLVERVRIADDRGSLTRLFCLDELSAHGWDGHIAQINHTWTRHAGTVRGLHFQWPPHAEVKLVSCIRGEVWDVAVDLRKDSPTFARWHAEVLSADNRRALLIPKGFAHGFQALSPDAELLYCHSAPYQQVSEGGIRVDDPRLAIQWPLTIANMSGRDLKLPLITDDFPGIAQ